MYMKCDLITTWQFWKISGKYLLTILLGIWYNSTVRTFPESLGRRGSMLCILLNEKVWKTLYILTRLSVRFLYSTLVWPNFLFSAFWFMYFTSTFKAATSWWNKTLKIFISLFLHVDISSDKVSIYMILTEIKAVKISKK